MILKFRCPACGQIHGLLAQVLFNAIVSNQAINFECPVTHEFIVIKTTITFEKEKSFTKEELQQAEIEEKVRDLQWKRDEELE